MLPNYSTAIISVIKLHYHGKIHIVKFSLRCNSTMIDSTSQMSRVSLGLQLDSMH